MGGLLSIPQSLRRCQETEDEVPVRLTSTDELWQCRAYYCNFYTILWYCLALNTTNAIMRMAYSCVLCLSKVHSPICVVFSLQNLNYLFQRCKTLHKYFIKEHDGTKDFIVVVNCLITLYMNDQSLRQGKAKQLRLKTTPFFSREKKSCLRQDSNP